MCGFFSLQKTKTKKRKSLVWDPAAEQTAFHSVLAVQKLKKKQGEVSVPSNRMRSTPLS